MLEEALACLLRTTAARGERQRCQRAQHSDCKQPWTSLQTFVLSAPSRWRLNRWVQAPEMPPSPGRAYGPQAVKLARGRSGIGSLSHGRGARIAPEPEQVGATAAAAATCLPDCLSKLCRQAAHRIRQDATNQLKLLKHGCRGSGRLRQGHQWC